MILIQIAGCFELHFMAQKSMMGFYGLVHGRRGRSLSPVNTCYSPKFPSLNKALTTQNHPICGRHILTSASLAYFMHSP